MERKIRIGIDVGGTFTDAIALDNSTYEIIGFKKIPTTHSAPEGITRGVIDVLYGLLDDIKVPPDSIVFIAHGTTQATNALLEGDVANVGVIGMANGLKMIKAKKDTQIGAIKLNDDKKIETKFAFINTKNGVDKKQIEDAVNSFLNDGLTVVVCSEAFSVDDPKNEIEASNIATEMGMITTSSHEISKLYGLRARTKTAVINASILPKMIQTANMTSNAVKNAQIQAPLMIMRSDGGVMQVEEMKRRPILTVLSGPAAGVAGALMYEKISDGIFLEVGGTSTDISAIQNGKVITKYAKIGKHSTYVTSLDINTIGIAGGSMVRIKDSKIVDVGPRSAHIAGLNYAIYADTEELKTARVISVKPFETDNIHYLAVETNKKKYAVTTTCAANYLGFVSPGDYAYAKPENGEILFSIISKTFGRSGKEIAQEIMDIAVSKVVPAVEDFIKEYHLNRNYLILTGGGGGASVIVPALAKKMVMKYKIAKNAPVISTIGAALAMVRDSVERTIVNPTREDILKIRAEAEQAAIKAGAARETIQVTIDIDSTKSIVKATAVGATVLSAHQHIGQQLDVKQLQQIVAQTIGDGNPEDVSLLFENEMLNVFSVNKKVKQLFGLFKTKRKFVCIVDHQGVIKLNSENPSCYIFSVDKLQDTLKAVVEENAVYDESGQCLPNIFLIINGKIVDLSGLDDVEQIVSLAALETEGLDENYKIFVLAKKRGKS